MAYPEQLKPVTGILVAAPGIHGACGSAWWACEPAYYIWRSTRAVKFGDDHQPYRKRAVATGSDGSTSELEPDGRPVGEPGQLCWQSATETTTEDER